MTGNELIAWRESRCLSRKELVFLLGYKSQTVYLLETGRMHITPRFLSQIGIVERVLGFKNDSKSIAPDESLVPKLCEKILEVLSERDLHKAAYEGIQNELKQSKAHELPQKDA